MNVSSSKHVATDFIDKSAAKSSNLALLSAQKPQVGGFHEKNPYSRFSVSDFRQFLGTLGSGGQTSRQEPAEKPAAIGEKDKADSKTADKDGWKSLLEEKSLEGWEATNFGGEGKVSVVDHQLTLETGDPLTGITYKRVFPTSNFEIELEAQRADGSDFLCGLTFPVGDKHCSFIAGGWGGGVLGISSVDGFDASENSTTQFMEFKNKKWYRFKVRVDDKTILAFIDDKQVVELEREGHEFSVRGEVLASRPLGYCAFQSKVLVRNFKWRPITADAAPKTEK